MATRMQTQAARRNARMAAAGAKQRRSLASLPKSTKTALSKQSASVAQRERTGPSTPKTRQELYEVAKRRRVRGRSTMTKAQLEKAVGR